MREAAMRRGFGRSGFGEAAMSAGAVLLLLGVLMSLDPRVREAVRFGSGAGRPATEVVQAGGRARDLVLVLLEAARDQSIDHAPLMIFALAAAVLVLFMVRT
jgi:hypothetical protein